MGGGGHDHRRERIEIAVGIVPGDPGSDDGEVGVLVDVVGVIDGHRDGVEMWQRDGDRRDVRIEEAVADDIPEAVGAPKPDTRHVVERSIREEGHVPAEGAVDEPGTDRVAVDIDVVGDDTGSGNR